MTFHQAANRFFRLTPAERRAILAQTGVPLDPEAGDDLHPFIDAGILIRRLVRTDITPRQADMLALMAEGISTRQIAARLGIRPATVEDHRRALYQRLGITASCPGPVAVRRWLASEIEVR